MWENIKRNIYWVLCKSERYDTARKRWIEKHKEEE